ncbi:MAG: carbon starvation CstA family protein [bacterium]
MLISIVLGGILIFAVGYVYYGRFLGRQVKLDDSTQTPACEINDGVDYVPAKPALLLGQHFSAIAAAGPIVGPILAGLWFGWIPAILWIILGAIFIGGVHDFTSLVASVRHKATSVGELVKQHISRTSYLLFLIFVWLALIYVIIAFTDITAHTFKAISSEIHLVGAGVAASSILYLAIGVIMGIALYKFKLNLTLATIIFLPLVMLIIWIGPRLPEPILLFLNNITLKQWDVLLLIYCFIASIIPMWLLLQPRGYLGGWLLYLTILVGLIGGIFGGFKIEYPAFNIDGLKSIVNGKPLFPLLFITVACGACSGFHAIVSSGTTSKQLLKESHARIIGYGGMLLEGLVAVLALATLIILPVGSDALKSDPNIIYAKGLAGYLGLIGVSFSIAFPFALLAFSTFVYDTLDVSTRLARYIFQEITGWQNMVGSVFATLITLLIPFIFLIATKEKGYLVAWPIFGTSNQLLASLTLLAITIWLIRSRKKAFYTIIPMFFMMVITLWSLALLILPFVDSLIQCAPFKPEVLISGVCGIILFVLVGWLVLETIRVLVLRGKNHSS